jgi:MinD-like ATPase involved in chromosome partitioning or flagellar assembly|tara:strand:+ start:1182 stop:3050 length:1869 start_codon:yes stop_codon:yes gene_type:complete
VFCTTFYSYKGGVGRTLALANVAARMADRGKRVLCVDFDLEAPGLSKLEPFTNRPAKTGLVDYIRKYEVEGEVDQIKNYIETYNIDFKGRSVSIDLLSAGGEGGDYMSDFSAIDWMKLYDERQGFLLFEEIRAQWTALGYDYVFIDSRTGYTDVGGICTRQLPDLVVFLFFPNDQNLVGLKEVANEVRGSKAREKRIDTFFVASRVPRLDDELNVLSGQLSKFQKSLGYRNDQFLTIWQYDSLSLLENGLFVADRPNSSLAKSYIELARAVSRYNVTDPQGALEFVLDELDKMNERDWSIEDESPDFAQASVNSLELIQFRHPEDSLIQGVLAELFYRRRMLFESTVSADRALAAFPNTMTEAKASRSFKSSVNLHRMRALNELDIDDEAMLSALAILEDENASDNNIVDAILFLASFNFEKLASVEGIPAIESAEPKRVIALVRRLGSSNRAPEFAARLLERMLARDDIFKRIDDSDVADLQIALISGQKFALARSLIEKNYPDAVLDIQEHFNYVMSVWADSQEIYLDLFTELYSHLKEERNNHSANFIQCQALVEAALGRRAEALKNLEAARKLLHTVRVVEFSCWSYRNVTAEVFEKHLELIEDFAAHGQPLPQFLRP